jgi:bifunctional non-homologous end joining protein LigD
MVTRRARTDGFIDPCIPTLAAKPPSGPDWVHEIKHDGYRLIVRRDGKVVRLFTRRGYDWTDRYPAIASAAAKLRARSFTLDGEAVVCGADCVAIFDALHRRGMVGQAILQAFDLLELNEEDYRPLPLSRRKRERTDPFRSAVPIDPDQWFRLIPITDSGRSRSVCGEV